MGSTLSTIKIVNNTNTDIITTSISDIDDFDFRDTPNRPDRNLDKVSIKAKKSLERRADLFFLARHCPFQITLVFTDKTEDTFRIDLKYATGCCHRFTHSRQSHKIEHKVDNEKIIITIENTPEQKRDEEAEELMRKAREAMMERLYHFALERIDAAKTLANSTATIEGIKNLEHEICCVYGETTFEEGLELEKEGHSERAQSTFGRAKSLFQRGVNLVYNEHTRGMLHMIDLKISGNRSFNVAMKLEDEAFEMVEREEVETGLAKYEKALNKYKEAREKFEEGARHRAEYFSDSVEIVDEHVENVRYTITKETMQDKIFNIKFNNRTQEKMDNAEEVTESVLRRREAHY